jgi:hypothetical protein
MFITELTINSIHNTEVIALTCSMKETAKMYLTSDELEKLDTLKILMSENQPVMIYGETGELYSLNCTRPCYILKYI